MKKTLFILLLVALVGSFAFAEVTGVAAPALSGSVSATFGVDLNNNATGFENSSSVDVVVPLAAGSDTKAGEGNMYAQITISDIDLSLSTDDAAVTYDASVSAKIVMGSLWIGLGNPDMTFNEVATGNDVDVNAETVGGTGGLSIGFSSDMFSASFFVASHEDWDNDSVAPTAAVTASWTALEVDADAGTAASAVNTANDYVFGANASVTAGPATIPVYFAYDAAFPGTTDAFMGVGVNPSVSVAGATVAVPVDYISVGTMNGLEADPSVSYALDGVGTFTADLEYFKYTNIATAADAMNVNFTYAEGITDMVTSTLAVGLTGLESGGTLGWTVDMDNTINLDGMAPYVNFGYGDDSVLDLQVGVALTSLIDNATVTLDYTSSDLTSAAPDKGVVTAAVAVSY